MLDEIIEDTETEDQDGLEVKSSIDEVHRPTDPDWVEYVLEQLSDREMINGAPTTDGLRRVTELVFGQIVTSDTDIISSSKDYVVAKHTLEIMPHSYSQRYITVSACVNVDKDKLPHPFCEHIVSTACTRAEGKALRRALKIRIHTAEELDNKGELDMESDELINDQQITVLKVQCKRLDIDLIKLVKANSSKPKTIKHVKNVEGRLIMNKVSEYQRDGVPDELAGYNQNWEEQFGT